MNQTLLSVLIGPVFDLVGKFFPSEEEKTKAKLAIIEADQRGELDATKTQLSAILAEAQSTDPWTSRARPSFLYVVYICILAGLPMGVLSAFKPEVATAIAHGFGAWLNAIPDSMWGLFGVGYLGYTGARAWEKGKGVTK